MHMKNGETGLMERCVVTMLCKWVSPGGVTKYTRRWRFSPKRKVGCLLVFVVKIKKEVQCSKIKSRINTRIGFYM